MQVAERVPLLTPRRPPRAAAVAAKLLQYGILLLFALIALLPILLVILTSLKTSREVAINTLGFPSDFQWGNYAQAWVQGRFGRYFLNSVIVTVPTVIGTVFLSTLAGYGFARFPIPGGKGLFYLFLLGLMVPFQSIMIPLFYILRDVGFLGSYWAFIVPSVAFGLPFGIFFMRAFFLRLPRELSEAARIDGANEWEVFWHVMMPLAGPGLTSLAVFNFMASWNNFLLPLIYMTREELRPVILGLMFFRNRYVQNLPLTMAGAVLVMIPIMLVYIMFQRKFIQGMTAGALKS